MLFLLIVVCVVSGSIAAAIATRRWAAARRERLSNERVEALASGYKKAAGMSGSAGPTATPPR